MSKSKDIAFDVALFKRILQYIKPYRLMFILTCLSVVGLSVFGAARPYVLQQAIDNNIAEKDYNGFLIYIIIMLALLAFEVVSNLFFIYYASWLGQSVVRDIRVKLYDHILNFKMKYYDNSSVG